MDESHVRGVVLDGDSVSFDVDAPAVEGWGGGMPSEWCPRSGRSGTCHMEFMAVRVPDRMGVRLPSL